MSDRTGESVYDVAAALDLLAMSLATGVAVVNSLESVAGVSGPRVSRQLREVAIAMQWGLPAGDAWAQVADVWQPAQQAFALAESTGAAPSGLLREAADTIRRDEATRLEAASARLGVLLVVPLGLCFLPAFFLIAVVPAVLSLMRQLMPHG